MARELKEKNHDNQVPRCGYEYNSMRKIEPKGGMEICGRYGHIYIIEHIR